MKYCCILVFVCWCQAFNASYGQMRPLSFEKTDSLMSIHKKPVLVLLTANWCIYCSMQKSILRKNKLIDSSADKFYLTILDVENNLPITFNKKTYHFKPTGMNTGVHELAVALNGTSALSLPTWIILDDTYTVRGRYNGVLDKKQLAHLTSRLDELNNPAIRPR